MAFVNSWGGIPMNPAPYFRTFFEFLNTAYAPAVGHHYTGVSDHRPVCSHLSAFYSGSKSASGFAYSIFEEKPAWISGAVYEHFQ